MAMIPAHPRPPLSLLGRRPSAATDDALDVAPRLVRFSRDALYAIFRTYSGVIWMPSFHCGAEVRAAADAGLELRFYSVRGDATVDEDDLARGLRGEPGPVMLIHYFGFAQPGTARIAALCRGLGVPLIEDCSHAFLSKHEGRPLGTFGDAATFSLYKTFGTAEGGAMRAAVDVAARRPVVAAGEHWHALRKRWRDAPRGRPHAALSASFARRVATARERIFDGPWTYGGGISRLSLALIRRIDADFVIDRRRENYARLDRLVRERGQRPLFEKLDEGVCPLYLPLAVRNRGDLLVRLQKAGVETFIFGMFAHRRMDEVRRTAARPLRDELLCLPVHHDLSARDMQRMAELLP